MNIMLRFLALLFVVIVRGLIIVFIVSVILIDLNYLLYNQHTFDLLACMSMLCIYLRLSHQTNVRYCIMNL